MRAYFATTSDPKLQEAEYCLAPYGVTVSKISPGDLPELLSMNLELISREKTVYAFKALRVPLFCEHGSLEVDALSGLPGSLSKVFYDAMGEGICDLVPAGKPRTAIASAAVTYCDGRRLHTFIGSVRGEISISGRGSRDYYYDRVFVPHSSDQTYAEMSLSEKLEQSHIKKAYDQLGAHLSHGR